MDRSFILTLSIPKIYTSRYKLLSYFQHGPNNGSDPSTVEIPMFSVLASISMDRKNLKRKNLEKNLIKYGVFYLDTSSGFWPLTTELKWTSLCCGEKVLMILEP